MINWLQTKSDRARPLLPKLRKCQVPQKSRRTFQTPLNHSWYWNRLQLALRAILHRQHLVMGRSWLRWEANWLTYRTTSNTLSKRFRNTSASSCNLRVPVHLNLLQIIRYQLLTIINSHQEGTHMGQAYLRVVAEWYYWIVTLPVIEFCS